MTSPSVGERSPVSSGSSVSEREPTLEELVAHFVAAKRSLSSVSHVWRANEIVTSARAALEEDAVLSAQNAFVKRAVDEQVNALEAIRHGVEQTAVEGQAEFKSVLQSLDAASARLQATLDALRTTLVEPSFRPPAEAPKHLYDFVDETGVGDLNRGIRACIDRFNAAHSALADASDAFAAALDGIHDALAPAPDPSVQHSGDNDDDHDHDDLPPDQPRPSPLPALFHALESRATDAAHALSSLVQHYDQCVTALKHTSGGAEAVSRAGAASPADAPALPSGLDLSLAALDAEPASPLAPAERAHLLGLVGRDAADVDDVVAEIRDRAAEMEDALAAARARVAGARAARARLGAALGLLRRVGGRVPGFIGAAAAFAARWEDERAGMGARMEELEGLRAFYDGFLRAYDGLVVEVERRRGVRERMERVVMEAAERLDGLGQEDAREREAFTREHGEFLPSDIWPGLTEPPGRWEGGWVGEGRVPEAGREVVERALRRLRE